MTSLRKLYDEVQRGTFQNVKDAIVEKVEGLFKASALHKAGYNAICVFGNRAKHLKDLLLSFNMNLIAICDNDNAGMKLGSDVENMGGEYIIFEKDLDEYDSSELELILIRGNKDGTLGIFNDGDFSNSDNRYFNLG